MNSRKRIASIIRKEFIHIRRDFRTLIIVIAMPIVMLFLYGFAINMETQNINLKIIDNDNSLASRNLKRKFRNSPYFTVSEYEQSFANIEELFTARIADMVLIIPFDFARRLQKSPVADVQVIIDASDSNKAQAIQNYTHAVLRTMATGSRPVAAFEITTAVWYNPAMKSSYFFVPGLAVLIMMMISALLTSIAIVREKETGTMEQILVSPIRPGEIIIGKVVPYMLLAMIDLCIILLIAYFVFAVPFIGSLLTLTFCSLIFIFVGLSLGLLISTKVASQQVAMLMALAITLLPTLMLSGFMFPLSSLPTPLWIISHAVPARYFLIVIRGIMLKGNTLLQLLPEVLTLAGFGILLVTISVKKFSTKLEQ